MGVIRFSSPIRASKKIQIRTMISNWHFVGPDSGLEKVHSSSGTLPARKFMHLMSIFPESGDCPKKLHL